VYEQAIERINRQKPGLKGLAKQVLFWISCAKRPLAISELQLVLAVEVGKPKLDEDNLPQIEDMVSVYAGLVTVDKESRIICLVYYTIQEYFKQTQECWFPNTETDITKVCIAYLSFYTFESSFCQMDAEFEKWLQLNQLYNYIVHNWGYYTCMASTFCQEVLSFLECKVKTEASGQVLIAVKLYSRNFSYSQEVPKQMTGLYLAVYFGVYKAVNTLIGYRQSLDLKDSYSRTLLLWTAGKE
jgi:hypothetical protein